MPLYHIGLVTDDENNLIHLFWERVNDVLKNRPAGNGDKRLRPLEGERPHAPPLSGGENDCLHCLLYNTMLASAGFITFSWRVQWYNVLGKLYLRFLACFVSVGERPWFGSFLF